MHTKNTLNADTLWFVTWRSAGPSVSVHGSKEAAQRRVENLIEYQDYDPEEIHIYAGKKWT